MEGLDLNSKTLDELWILRERVCSMLTIKLKAEKCQIEKRLGELRGTFRNDRHEVRQRRPYPKVHAKFRNPEPPHETWSGRGTQPRWLRKLLKNGKTIEDLRILKRPQTKKAAGAIHRSAA